MQQLALAFCACPGCGSTSAWLRPGACCGCGWLSDAQRRRGRIREFYAKRAPRPKVRA